MSATRNAEARDQAGFKRDEEKREHSESTGSSAAAQARPGDSLRAPPAYQTYASDELASATYYRLSLAERGLLDAMRRAAWIDGAIPEDAEELALAVRRPVEEVRQALSAGVLRHFVCGDPGMLICPELERQRERLLVIRSERSKAGRKGGRPSKKKERGNA